MWDISCLAWKGLTLQNNVTTDNDQSWTGATLRNCHLKKWHKIFTWHNNKKYLHLKMRTNVYSENLYFSQHRHTPKQIHATKIQNKRNLNQKQLLTSGISQYLLSNTMPKQDMSRQRFKVTMSIYIRWVSTDCKPVPFMKMLCFRWYTLCSSLLKYLVSQYDLRTDKFTHPWWFP
jgi:hypothetical protein